MRTLSLALGLTLLSFSTLSWGLTEGLRFQQNSRNKAAALRADGSFRTSRTDFFSQKLDHTNSRDTRTFKQRFFIDSVYARSEAAPVFYIICGEWNCAGTGSYTIAEKFAQQFGAHLVALEHRFYGESSPFEKLTTQNLETLNIHSAVEDLANFQRYAMAKLGMKGKWVAFGGSYAGSLSAFYRLKHPELVTGALASSAPVLMKNEFSEYDAHIAQVISKSACGEKVREAVNLIEDKLRTEAGTQEVKALFRSADIRLEEDFLYAVADMLAAAVQYGKDEMFCKELLATPDLIKGYARGGLAVISSMGMTPMSLTFQSAEDLKMTPDSYFRQWIWQSCQEFGWFQVANHGALGAARSHKIDLPYHDNACQRLFGQSMSADGALNPAWYTPLFDSATNRIIFTNGSNDPWLRLSITDSSPTNPGFDVFMMNGGAHCDDLRAATSIPAVMAAQVKLSSIIQGWLN